MGKILVIKESDDARMQAKMKYYIRVVENNHKVKRGKLVPAREALEAFNTLTKECYSVMKKCYISIQICDENGTKKRNFQY